MTGTVLFVSGIDTDVGKTFAAGVLARELLNAGRNVITQKLIQTGCPGSLALDIAEHRRLMGCGLLEVDRLGLTAPYVLKYPASPHLTAELEGVQYDFGRIDDATRRLQREFELVLLEGAGGLMVPLTRNYLAIDFIEERNYPLILVTSGKLGSINHTLLSLEAAARRGIEIAGVIYNRFPVIDDLIEEDSRRVIADYLEQYAHGAAMVELPPDGGDVDFRPLLTSLG